MGNQPGPRNNGNQGKCLGTKPGTLHNLDTVLSRFTDYKTDLAPEAQEGLDFLASLGLDETPTGYQAADSAHDNQTEDMAPELEEQHDDDQDAEL